MTKAATNIAATTDAVTMIQINVGEVETVVSLASSVALDVGAMVNQDMELLGKLLRVSNQREIRRLVSHLEPTRLPERGTTFIIYRSEVKIGFRSQSGARSEADHQHGRSIARFAPTNRSCRAMSRQGRDRY